jgi:hypothetical protein
MRTLRLSLAGTVVLALLCGLGGAVVAQEEDAWFGDWLEPTEEGTFGYYGPDLTKCVLDKSERESVAGPMDALGISGKEVLNLLFTCEVVFSDPRLSGTQTTRFNEHCFAKGGCVNWGTMDIVGADGAWSGWFNGIEDPTGQTDLHIVLTGSEAYEGLTNIRHANGGFGSALTQTGVIYNSDPPPVPRAE